MMKRLVTNFHTRNALIWAAMIVACSFAANVLKEPEMIMYILIAGFFASTGLLRPGREVADSE